MTHFFATARGRRIRDAVLLRDLFTCQMCGVIVTAGKRDSRGAVVDHTEPVALSPDKVDDLDNLRCTCARCHNTVCAAIEARAQGDLQRIKREKLAYRPVGADGYPVSR